MAALIAVIEVPRNGGAPAIISNRTTVRPHTSNAGRACSPSSASGLIYSGVPATCVSVGHCIVPPPGGTRPVHVRVVVSATVSRSRWMRATPKSRSFGTPVLVNRDVARLDVPVVDGALVRWIEATRRQGRG